MNMKSFSKDEEMIFSIIEAYRTRANEFIKEQMTEAFDKIGNLLADKSMCSISKDKINGISHETLKDLYRIYRKGERCHKAGETHMNRWYIEFIRANSLSFEAQKARYPNFMKKWTREDDDLLLKLWHEGLNYDDLSEIFLRHRNSIRSRIDKLII